jgi:hypothetical protein
MSNQPFNNNTDQQTRRQILKDTYFSRAQADADMIGGRFRKQTETRVTGAPQYPRQPSNSPWARGIDEIAGVEPPLGFEEFIGALGGESPAPVVVTVETANATDRGASPNALTGAPRFLRRRI